MKLLKHWHWHYILIFLRLQLNGSPEVSYCTRSQTKDWNDGINFSNLICSSWSQGHSTGRAEPLHTSVDVFRGFLCPLSVLDSYIIVGYMFLFLSLFTWKFFLVIYSFLSTTAETFVSLRHLHFCCWHSFGLRNRKFYKKRLIMQSLQLRRKNNSIELYTLLHISETC